MTIEASPHPEGRSSPPCETPSFFVDSRFAEAFARLGLTSLDAAFAFESGRDLAKPNIGRFRRRVQFEAMPAGQREPVKIFMKRYDRPPILGQILNWFSYGRRMSFAAIERNAIEDLAAAGVGVPRIAAFGEEWGSLFERRSFLMTEEIRDSQSLEHRLPECFSDPATVIVLRARRDFIRQLAEFIQRFHATGRRHRDLYLCHIFCSNRGEFHLIDLARASRPLLQRRFQIKDLAQLHYSSPAKQFSRTDRMRFFLAYVGRVRLLSEDKTTIRAVLQKTASMVRHNLKHGGTPPCLDRTEGGR